MSTDTTKRSNNEESGDGNASVVIGTQPSRPKRNSQSVNIGESNKSGAMTLQNKAAYSTDGGGCFRYTNIRAFVCGGIQIILGIMAIGSGIIMLVMQSLGWMICLGLWGGGILLASGLFSVRASTNKLKSNVQISMGLGIAGFIVSIGLVFLGIAGLYVDGVDDTLIRRVDSALSMGAHIINLFTGGWGCAVTLFVVMSTWPYVVGDKPFINTVGPDSEALTGCDGGSGKLSKEEAAAEKKRRKEEEKERKKREKEEKERQKREEQEAKKRKKAEEEEAKRLAKEEEARKKAAAAAGGAAAGGAGSRRASRRRPTMAGDEEPDSDFEYDSDEFDDDDVIEGETPEERRKRRRMKAWQLQINKRYITGKDPFSKDRVYNKTWEKKSKEEFKETKAQTLRRKMMEEKKAKQ
ncbi:uncharacterized protein LOC135483367 [Lineus longissimus]|uniref:uncharacterized protein LOC135483367 n=1 Tax=Lineus longissimus TaxID=88925 RepID=UPI00315C8B38